ncbi:ATP-grasp fold amidoligase family protein [Christiangramia marina]|uniref:ATP-grasp fold amidoligase family protein n=1 Tax=Christiangramia marina TaxID=409436 RepID=UPI003AA8546F
MNFKSDIRFHLYKLYRHFRRKFIDNSPTVFQKRIQKRWEIFWRDATDLHLIEDKFDRQHSMETWKNIENWQRRLENKYNAKQFALKFGCKVAKLYWHGKKEDFENLDINNLPENYIIKPLFGESSKNIFLMKNGCNLFDSKEYTPKSLRNEINALFNSQDDLEIIIEEFIPNENGDFVIPDDYKFYCFNGTILFLQVNKRKGINKDRITFYNEDWKFIKRKILNEKAASIKKIDVPPSCLKEMVEDVKKLSEVYGLFVRIDFYATAKGPVFGEFTATPRRGKHFTRYGSRRLIKMWDQHCNGLI